MAKNQPAAGTRNRRTQHGSQQGERSLSQVNADLVGKVPPQNIDAEQAVLGGVFLRNSLLHTLIDLLRTEDFYSPVHRIIYQVFLDLYRTNVPIDLVTVADELQKRDKLDDVGGAVYLTSLTESVASAANALSYAAIVRDKAVRRELIHESASIITEAFESTDDTESILDRAEQHVFGISEGRVRPGFKMSKELVNQVFEYLEHRFEQRELITGVPTGYQQFDEITAGLQRTDLIIVAGRPSMGKTAFALNMCMRSAILYEVPTAIFSLEMSMEQLMMRMLCSWGKVDLSRMRSGFLDDEDWTRLYQAADDLNQAPI